MVDATATVDPDGTWRVDATPSSPWTAGADRVTVEGRDQVSGWGGATVEVELVRGW